MIESQCEQCGTTFTAPAHKKRRFCSKSCASTWTHAHGFQPGRQPGRKKSGQIRPCEVCGTEIYVKAWQDRLGQGRFCGVPCYNVWQSRNGEKKPCEWCGKEMRLRPHAIEIRRFCSMKCQAEGRRTQALDLIHNGRRASLDAHGYVRVWEPEHPNAYDGWVMQHRLVMEQHLGRLLETSEHVHHLDGDKTNNDVSNLIVLGAGDHQRETIKQMTVKRKQDRDELEEYRKRFGPLTE